MSSEIQRVEVPLGEHTLTLETGKLAGQANGAVTARFADTMILATAVADDPRPGLDFFPLIVDFEERMYAAGKMPGSRFIRRESRPSEQATLTARLIDHAIRPLFPKTAMDDVQVVITTLAADPDFYPDALAIVGASAALHVSDIEFAGPIGAAKVAWLEGDFIVNPTWDQEEESELVLIVAGAEDRVLMIECEGKEVPEEILVDAMETGMETVNKLCEAQEELRSKAGRKKGEMRKRELPDEILQAVTRAVGRTVRKALLVPDKAGRDAELNKIREKLEESLAETFPEQQSAIREAFDIVCEKAVRKLIVQEGKRPDGRELTQVRPLTAEVDVLPRVHGSALFQRGETQALSIVTLATLADSKLLDGLGRLEKKYYLHHYNFPPYSTGESKPMRGPGRREIGHGALAEKALRPVLPPIEDFPYTVRVVSEIMSSNGSTSMAATCGSTLALMDAGVPIEAPVAGISIGWVTDEKDPDKYVLLTDIQGVEDFCGDMDFKVTGTRQGVTAIQLDQKKHGVPLSILAEALEQAREARVSILDVMEEAIDEPREELSEFAPKIFTIQIPVDKIGALIGPGGKVIRGIQEDTGTQIDVEEDGTVFIATPDQAKGEEALSLIRGMTREPVIGEEYRGKVVRILGIGAFVEILPGKDGLVHISELDWHHVDRVEDVVNIGDEVKVKVIEIDQQGRINLSRKQCLPKPSDADDDGGGRRGGGHDRDRRRTYDRDRSHDRGRPHAEGNSRYSRRFERDRGRNSRREPRNHERSDDHRRRESPPERGRRGSGAAHRSATARRVTSKKQPPRGGNAPNSQPKQPAPRKVIDHTQTAVRPGDHLVSKTPAFDPWGSGTARTPQIRSRRTRND